jgi:hypothetical protein
MDVAIYSASVTRIPFLDKFEQHLVFFGFTRDSKRDVMVRIDGFLPYLLVYPKQEDMVEPYNNEDYLQYIATQINEEFDLAIAKVEIIQKVPSQEFHNSQTKILLKFSFAKDRFRSPILTFIQTQKQFGAISLEYVVHDRLTSTVQYLYDIHSFLQTWFSLDSFHYLDNRISTCINVDVSHIDSMFQSNVDLKDVQVIPNVMYVTGFATSKLATKTSNCEPNAVSDPLSYIAYSINGQDAVCLCNQDEVQLLLDFGHILHSNNIHIIAFITDTIHIMEYITIRAQQLHCDFTWSKIKHVQTYRKPICKLDKQTNQWVETGDYDLIHPGMERMDLSKQLQKTQCKPALVQFTLLHAIRHPKLIKQNNAFQLFYDPNYEPPNTFHDSPEVIATNLKLQVLAMHLLVEQNGILANILTVSKSNDISIRDVIERGQQKRIYGAFMRDWHENNLYLDPMRMNIPTVLLPKGNQDSSFCDPPWMENPNIPQLIEQDTSPVGALARTLKDKTGTGCIFGMKPPPPPPLKKQKIDDTKNAIAKDELGGGLVLNTVPGFYKCFIFTVDWSSMYPNIILSNGICPMTLIRDSKWLQDPKATLQYIPRNKHFCDVRIIAYDGKPVQTFLPRVVTKFLDARERERTLGGLPNISPQEKIARAMAELAFKCSANAVYGFFGSRTSGLTSFALASNVTKIGQFMQKTVRYQILKAGGAVLYGDTDSCMLVLPTPKNLTNEQDILAYLLEEAMKIATTCTNIFKGNKIIVETVKSPIWLLPQKKTYAALERAVKDGKASETVKELFKGVGSIKRDKCTFAKDICLEIGRTILYQKRLTIQEQCQWFAKQLDRLPFCPIEKQMDLEPFILSAALNNEYKNEVVALEVAKLLELETGKKPKKDDRLCYVIAYFEDDTLLHCKRAVPIHYFLKRKMRLDCKFYLLVQIYGCLKQLLCLPIHQSLLSKLKCEVDKKLQTWNLHLCAKTSMFQRK